MNSSENICPNNDIVILDDEIELITDVHVANDADSCILLPDDRDANTTATSEDDCTVVDVINGCFTVPDGDAEDVILVDSSAPSDFGGIGGDDLYVRDEWLVDDEDCDDGAANSGSVAVDRGSSSVSGCPPGAPSGSNLETRRSDGLVDDEPESEPICGGNAESGGQSSMQIRPDEMHAESIEPSTDGSSIAVGMEREAGHNSGRSDWMNCCQSSGRKRKASAYRWVAPGYVKKRLKKIRAPMIPSPLEMVGNEDAGGSPTVAAYADDYMRDVSGLTTVDSEGPAASEQLFGNPFVAVPACSNVDVWGDQIDDQNSGDHVPLFPVRDSPSCLGNILSAPAQPVPDLRIPIIPPKPIYHIPYICPIVASKVENKRRLIGLSDTGCSTWSTSPVVDSPPSPNPSTIIPPSSSTVAKPRIAAKPISFVIPTVATTERSLNISENPRSRRTVKTNSKYGITSSRFDVLPKPALVVPVLATTANDHGCDFLKYPHTFSLPKTGGRLASFEALENYLFAAKAESCGLNYVFSEFQDFEKAWNFAHGKKMNFNSKTSCDGKRFLSRVIESEIIGLSGTEAAVQTTQQEKAVLGSQIGISSNIDRIAVATSEMQSSDMDISEDELDIVKDSLANQDWDVLPEPLEDSLIRALDRLCQRSAMGSVGAQSDNETSLTETKSIATLKITPDIESSEQQFPPACDPATTDLKIKSEIFNSSPELLSSTDNANSSPPLSSSNIEIVNPTCRLPVTPLETVRTPTPPPVKSELLSPATPQLIKSEIVSSPAPPVTTSETVLPTTPSLVGSEVVKSTSSPTIIISETVRPATPPTIKCEILRPTTPPVIKTETADPVDPKVESVNARGSLDPSVSEPQIADADGEQICGSVDPIPSSDQLTSVCPMCKKTITVGSLVMHMLQSAGHFDKSATLVDQNDSHMEFSSPTKQL